MDVRIGVSQAPRELTFDVSDDQRDALRSQVEAALTGAIDVLWVLDRRGRETAVPSVKIAYVEIGTGDAERRIGFGG